MFKRLLTGAGFAGALATTFLLGSLTLGSAFAQSPAPTAQPPAQATPQAGAGTTSVDKQEQQPGYVGSIAVPQDQKGQSEPDEAKALASQARITADQAKAAALAQFPGATVKKVELDNENGSLVYSVQLTDTSGKGQDVKVDAGNGKVLATEADGPEGVEGHGSAEKSGAED